MQTLTTALAERGYNVAAAMPLDDGNVELDDFRQRGVPLIPLRYPSATVFHRIRELAGVFKAESPQLVHAHGSRAAFWAYWALPLARLTQTQLMVSIHGFVTPFYSQPRRFVQTSMQRWISRRASWTIACAHAERDALLEARVASAAQVRVVHYGMDLSALLDITSEHMARSRAALGVSPRAWLLLMLCRLDRPRDFDSLLRAFRRVADTSPNAQLFVVGGGPARAEVEALIDALELQQRVTLWGFRKDVDRFYAAADAYVLTSWGWEGLPISVIEAQAAGLPVVVTDVGGSKEAIDPGRTGVLVPPRDSHALQVALQHLATHPTEAADMGRQGREYVGAQFCLEPMVEKLAELYASLGVTP